MSKLMTWNFELSLYHFNLWQKKRKCARFFIFLYPWKSHCETFEWGEMSFENWILKLEMWISHPFLDRFAWLFFSLKLRIKCYKLIDKIPMKNLWNPQVDPCSSLDMSAPLWVDSKYKNPYIFLNWVIKCEILSKHWWWEI
jgi:hypothetical protein